MKRIIILALIILISQNIFAQDKTTIKKETFLYAVKGKDSLFLDKYTPSHGEGKALFEKNYKPSVIFVFGGAFFTGKRDEPRYVKYFDWLVENGFTVFSIDYRLGLKPIVEETEKTGHFPKMGPKKMVNLMLSSVNMAVEDLYTSTNYILSKSSDFNINPNLIISCGSSAGAITVLTGEYYKTNNNVTGKYPLANALPRGFNYAGVISFAGAIPQKGGIVKWDSIPAPIQMFHGNADCNVPYGKIRTILGGFYGSQFIAKQLNFIDAPHYFFTVDNANHVVAISPMVDYREEILHFLNSYVIGGNPYIFTSNLSTSGQVPKNKNIGIRTLIKSNFLKNKDIVKMLSYNVHNCIAIDPQRTRDYDAIAQIIKDSKAEVIALQELDSITSRTNIDVLAKLSELTGMHPTFSPSIDFEGGKYGIGMLSKEKPKAVKLIALPGREEQRSLMIAEFDNYIFCNTHLSLTPEDQLASIDIINQCIKEFIKGDKDRKRKNLFIAGDFNAVPGSATINKLQKTFTPISNDMYKTYPANFPDRCIDYIFYYGKKLPKKYQVYESGTIKNSTTQIASDHLPTQCVIYAPMK